MGVPVTTSSRPGTNQKIAYTGTAAASAAFGAETYQIRIVVTSNAWYAIGQNPTASTSTGGGTYLPLGIIEYIRVAPGEKISFVQDSAGGNASVTEMTH